MSLPDAVTPVILDTILGHLAPHFLADTQGDRPAARHAASQMLAAYDAETAEELCLAAEIIGFGSQALKALGEAASSDRPVSEKFGHRVSAANLIRQVRDAQRRLDQARRLRRGASELPRSSRAGETGVGAVDVRALMESHQQAGAV
ncbi:hypothetical protein [Acidisphaera sp. S103]|uniref:hypothetical protein n=1 Tax=Acidisphaera sp. S103 TaxID=1747223 RepID=UPI00131EADD2|nr:hypothetical protein [Acidisphaera sp. S103]